MTGRHQLSPLTRFKAEARRGIYTAAEQTRYRYRAARSLRDAAAAAVANIMLITDFGEFTSDQQYAPVMRHSRLLHSNGNINSAVCDLTFARHMKSFAFNGIDLVGIKLSYTVAPDKATEIISNIKDQIPADAKLVYFDGDDDLNVQWPSILNTVDLYVKKHIFRETADYTRTYIGKSNLSDYVARIYDPSFVSPENGQSGPLSEAAISKIRIGWNIGLDDRIARLARRGALSPDDDRPIDICGRATASSTDWMYPLRRTMTDELSRLSGQFKVAVPTQRVTLSDYYRELEDSAICVSPFGWGEICWRDFEAILSGCLLVKPDMAHVYTEPNIFVPGETYAPVAWDYSDLGEVCRKYLDDRDARIGIVRRAQNVLLEALKPSWLLERMRVALEL